MILGVTKIESAAALIKMLTIITLSKCMGLRRAGTEGGGLWAMGLLAYLMTVLGGCGDLKESERLMLDMLEEPNTIFSDHSGQSSLRSERPWSGDPPRQLTDANGWVWERQHKIKYSFVDGGWHRSNSLPAECCRSQTRHNRWPKRDCAAFVK